MLEEFSSIQQDHVVLLTQEKMKTLPGWIEKRQQAFLRLTQCLERFDPTSVSGDTKFAVRIRREMDKILQGERFLASLVGKQREVIQEKLRAMRKGKTALKGYCSTPAAGPKPKYLSSRT